MFTSKWISRKSIYQSDNSVLINFLTGITLAVIAFSTSIWSFDRNKCAEKRKRKKTSSRRHYFPFKGESSKSSSKLMVNTLQGKLRILSNEYLHSFINNQGETIQNVWEKLVRPRLLLLLPINDHRGIWKGKITSTDISRQSLFYQENISKYTFVLSMFLMR